MKDASKVLSGDQIEEILAKFSFVIDGSKRNHSKLRRYGIVIAGREILIVPVHSPLAQGTLRAIYNQACRHIKDPSLRSYFYSD